VGASQVKAILATSVVLATDVGPLEGELAISVATIAELQFGVLVTADDMVRSERLRRLSIFQRTFDALPVDDAVATSYGQLAAAVVKVGRQPRARVMDLLIAATAHAHSARLYTRNAADLIGIEHLIDRSRLTRSSRDRPPRNRYLAGANTSLRKLYRSFQLRGRGSIGTLWSR
jgi:predicted nucleic acid-binding protein